MMYIYDIVNDWTLLIHANLSPEQKLLLAYAFKCRFGYSEGSQHDIVNEISHLAVNLDIVPGIDANTLI